MGKFSAPWLFCDFEAKIFYCYRFVKIVILKYADALQLKRVDGV